MKRYRISVLAMVLLLLLSWSAHACSIPVFRYALERWMADYYEGILIHRGPIADDDPAAMLLQSEKAEFLNLRLSKIDLDSSTETETGTKPAERIKSELGIEVSEKLPALVLWYPWHKGRAAPFWTGEFMPSTVKALIESPKRQELARRLTGGQTTVWIFVESGNTDKDKAALHLINQELETATQQLKEMLAGYSDQLGLSSVYPQDALWRYEFSVLSVSRTDPQEQMMLTMLLNSEPDLDKYADEPIVFPVFGRGRVLFALVGEGINVDNLQEAIAFLTGPCGCEIKMMNPGMDLLMAVNWEDAAMRFYEEFYETYTEVPELTGVTPEEPAEANLKTEDSTINTQDEGVKNAPGHEVLAPDDDPTPADNEQTLAVKLKGRKLFGLGIIGTTGVVLAVILFVVVLGTIAISPRRKGHL